MDKQWEYDRLDSYKPALSVLFNSFILAQARVWVCAGACAQLVGCTAPWCMLQPNDDRQLYARRAVLRGVALALQFAGNAHSTAGRLAIVTFIH
jgi:hypothetical protein